MTKKSKPRPDELHGMRYSREYVSWAAMKSRCLRKNHVAFKYYGGRGITICHEWKDSFVNFYSDMGPRPEGRSLDRIDVNGNYDASNCCWSTAAEQLQNSRLTKLTMNKARLIRWLVKSKTFTHRQLAKLFGISHGLIYRISKNKGWKDSF